MTPDLQEALLKDFPLVFHGLWGKYFDVGDGWEPIVRRCAQRISALIEALPEDARAEVTAVQVKEKFGGLRFYMSLESAAMTSAIWDAEREAWATCETCGAPGQLRSDRRWLRTECNIHFCAPEP